MRIDLATLDVQATRTPGRHATALVVDLDEHVWAANSQDREVAAYDGVDATEVVSFTPAEICPDQWGGPCTRPRLFGDPTAARFRRVFGTVTMGTVMTHVVDTTCDDHAELTLSWELGEAGGRATRPSTCAPPARRSSSPGAPR